MLFEPLNNKFKGFVNQREGNVLKNKKCQFVINYKDLSDDIFLLNLPEKISEKNGKVEMGYYIQMSLYNTG